MGRRIDRLSDTDLLQVKFCDLPVRLKGTAVEARARRVFADLKERGLKVRPSIWLSEEWFNPEGTVGFAIPFYLAHPRLTRLERRLMLEAEGVTENEALRIIRHETGHTIDEAFQFFKRPDYAKLFGSPKRRYPTSYAAAPHSRDHVMHLNAWYAQSHPVEDFAETFATWLRPKAWWRRRYKDWPALKKLEAIDAWLTDCRGNRPLNTERAPVGVLAESDRTLAEHYEEKRAFYSVGASTKLDDELKRIFASPRQARGAGRRTSSATSLLRTIRSPVRKEVARPLGVPAYTVEQVLRQVIQRTRALDLKYAGPVEETVNEVVKLVSQETVAILRKAPRLPL